MVTSKPVPARVVRYLSKVEIKERLFELLFHSLGAEDRKMFEALSRAEKTKLLYSLGIDAAS